jgi:hypothetical protein
MNFSPYFPHLISDMGEYRCIKDAPNAVEHLRASRKFMHGKPSFFYERKWNYIYDIYDSLEVNKAFIKFVHYIMEYNT